MLRKNSRLSEHEQFGELMKAISYGMNKLKSKKWNLSDYFLYMAEFYKYIDRPEDADDLTASAKQWEKENL